MPTARLSWRGMADAGRPQAPTMRLAPRRAALKCPTIRRRCLPPVRSSRVVCGWIRVSALRACMPRCIYVESAGGFSCGHRSAATRHAALVPVVGVQCCFWCVVRRPAASCVHALPANNMGARQCSRPITALLQAAPCRASDQGRMVTVLLTNAQVLSGMLSVGCCLAVCCWVVRGSANPLVARVC